jgi:hypothetical protein
VLANSLRNGIKEVYAQGKNLYKSAVPDKDMPALVIPKGVVNLDSGEQEFIYQAASYETSARTRPFQRRDRQNTHNDMDIDVDVEGGCLVNKS